MYKLLKHTLYYYCLAKGSGIQTHEEAVDRDFDKMLNRIGQLDAPISIELRKQVVHEVAKMLYQDWQDWQQR